MNQGTLVRFHDAYPILVQKGVLSICSSGESCANAQDMFDDIRVWVELGC